MADFKEVTNAAMIELLKVIILVAFSLVIPILVQTLRRAGISMNSEREALLNQIAMIAAAEAEEWAAKKLKNDLPVSSGEKSDRALISILGKLPKLSVPEAKSALGSALPQIGLGASSALTEIEKAKEL